MNVYRVYTVSESGAGDLMVTSGFAVVTGHRKAPVEYMLSFQDTSHVQGVLFLPEHHEEAPSASPAFAGRPRLIIPKDGNCRP
jgi:hypothetical protein